jgi:proteic killer suppression protein
LHNVLSPAQESLLRFQFKTKRLETLYTQEKGAHKYPAGVIDAFFDVMAIIDGAQDERDLYALKGLRYEKLKGKRKEQHSIRLNDQFRLVVQRKEDEKGRHLLIIGIEDYH